MFQIFIVSEMYTHHPITEQFLIINAGNNQFYSDM
jgi:hypothetical protein